jgi:hypothetical protein
MSKSDAGTITALSETATRYYHAMVAGNEAELRSLFDGRAALMGHFEGEFQWLDLDGFIDETKNLIGQHGEEICSVESVRVDGDIATVAIRGRYAGLWFLDHLSLVEVDGRWLITSKSFHVLT